MSLNRYDKKRDANEPEIVAALEEEGCQVKRITEWDLMVMRWDGQLFMLEVKNPKGRDKVEKSQREMIEAGWPLHIVRNAQQALEVVLHRGNHAFC